MKLSLVMPTIGRTVEPQRFFQSLRAQTFTDFELIVVDQNRDRRLLEPLERFRAAFPIIYLRPTTIGASHARNFGLRAASGDVITFPDDDCWYGDPTLLERVASTLAARPRLAAVTGRALDQHGLPCQLRWPARSARLNPFNLWRRAVEFTMFIRRELFETIGGFDEHLGPPWSAGEGSDLLIRALNAGFRIDYEPDLVVQHPNPVAVYDERARRRAYCYSVGFGRTLRKNGYPAATVAYHCARPAGAAMVALLLGRYRQAGYYWAATRGKVRGFFRPGPDATPVRALPL